MFLFGRKFLFLVIISQLVAPKDASANTSADQIFSSNSDGSNPITAVVEKPDSLTLPTLSSNPKSKIQNSKLPQVETITTENLVHNLDTTLSISGADNLSGFPGKLYVYDKLVSNDDYEITS